MTTEQSIYDQIGGTPAITVVVSDFTNLSSPTTRSRASSMALTWNGSRSARSSFSRPHSVVPIRTPVRR